MRRVSITRCGLRISTIEATWATLHGTLTTGAFLTGFALFLGVNDLQLGIISAIPPLAQIFQIAASWLMQTTGKRKSLVAWTSVIGRSLWLPMALTPILFPGGALGWFLGFFFLYVLLMNLSAPAWTMWMCDLVPSAIRGRYFGFRNRVVGLMTIAASVGGGFAVDWCKEAGSEYAGYLTIQIAAVVCGIVAFRYIRLQPDPGYRPEPVGRLATYILGPIRHPTYRSILVFFIYWLFAVGVSEPFFAAHLLKNLGWNFRALALLSVLTTLLSVICHPAWGVAIDRYGHRPVLKITATLILHLPLYYAFCPAGVSWPIYANALLTGILWSGFNLAMFSLLLNALPPTGRPIYIAVTSALSGIVNFLSALAGGWIAESLADWSWHWRDFSVVNYQVVFLLTFLLRAPGLLFLRHLPDPGAAHTVILLRQMFVEINRRIGTGRQIFAVTGKPRRPRKLQETAPPK